MTFASSISFLTIRGGHFLARVADHFASRRIHEIEGRAGAANPLGEEFRHPAAFALGAVVNGVVIGVHDAFLVETKRIEERRDRQLTATVDAREDEIFRVEFEVQPRTAVGNDAASEQEFPRGMRLATVVVEEHARRAVHLGHDNPLGAVHDERPVRGHQRHVAHVDVLFFDVFDRACARGLVNIEHDQTQCHLQGCCVGHVTLLTFVNVVFRLFELVFYELQNRVIVEILDREDRLENTLNAFTIQRLGCITRPQEQIIGRFLNLNQVRHLEDFANFAVVPADTLLTNVSLSHARRHLSSFRRRAYRRGPVGGAWRLRGRFHSCPPSQRGAPEP